MSACTKERVDECRGFHLGPLTGMHRIGGDALVGRVLEAWLQSTPARIATLDQALLTGDTDRIRVEAHTLKSSCASIGLMNLSSFARRLEEQARQGNVVERPARRSELARLYTWGQSQLEHLAAQGLKAALAEPPQQMPCEICRNTPDNAASNDTGAVFSDD